MCMMGTVILSDLHIAAGSLDNCDAELETHAVAFFQEHLTRLAPVELVINGDFLDFVQAPPSEGQELESRSPNGVPLCFSQEQSLAKLSTITAAHPRVFQALNAFLDSHPDNTLVVLPGNHDADFFWPAVRSDFSRLIGSHHVRSGRLRIHLESVYRPLRSPGLWVEHGHQHDSCNVFAIDGKHRWSTHFPPILPDLTGQDRLLECVGTRFLIRFLNRLGRDYPFLDNVKPFTRFLQIFGFSAFHPDYGPLKAAVAIWSILEFLTATGMTAPTHLLTLPDSREDSVHPLLRHFRSMPPDGRALLGEILHRHGTPLRNRSTEMILRDTDCANSCMRILADHIDELGAFRIQDSSLLGFAAPAGTLTLLRRPFLRNESEVLIDIARDVLRRPDVEFVVMGHTHDTKYRPNGLGYCNTGCWIRNHDAQVTIPQSWTMLRPDNLNHYPYQLNYAWIPEHSPNNTELLASLFTGSRKNSRDGVKVLVLGADTTTA